MEVGNTAVQTMALDLAVAEFRRRVREHVFMNNGQLSPLCHLAQGNPGRARHGGEVSGERADASALGDRQRNAAGWAMILTRFPHRGSPCGW